MRGRIGGCGVTSGMRGWGKGGEGGRDVWKVRWDDSEVVIKD